MTYPSIYQALIYLARSDGWRVHHVNLGNSANGDIEIKDRLIRIDKSLSTKDKIITLAHELGHAAQWKTVETAKSKRLTGKTYLYYKYLHGGNSLAYNPTNWNMVKFCEIDASHRGVQLLQKLFGLNWKRYFSELDLKERKKWIEESWRKSYFDDPP